MEGFVMIIHFVAAAFLILLILLQTSKGSEIGAAFGGASQTLFGSRGPATFLSKITIIIAVIFLVTSVALAHMAKSRSVKSVLETEVGKASQEQVMPEKVDESSKEAPKEAEQK